MPDVVKAKAFHVVGKDGAVLVKLVEDTFGLGRGKGTVKTLNGKGQTLVELGSTLGGDGVVMTMNGKGHEAVPDVVKAKVFYVVGKNRKPAVTLYASSGGGRVMILNGEGQELVTLGVTEGGNGMVTTKNGKGQKLVELGARKDGPGGVLVYDPRSIEARRELTTGR